MTNWKKTQVWQKLSEFKNDEADKVKAFLLGQNCMNRIEQILKAGETSPKDFTLHDADHSFRVAERMWEIIPPTTQAILSEYELAFLLLSAYLHDIGMTPEIKKVKNHYLCLNSTDKSVLTVLEKHNFQKWLDDEGENIDLEKDNLSNEDKAAELVTFYCRHRHNDWSEEWIRNNFKETDFGHYTNWLNDLVNICKSHHYGFEELKSEKFNPLRIHGRVIHKRYIAMCLRLADVIEIDPERAPEVLIKHRNIIKGSISHWLKEKFTSVSIENNCIVVTANPTKAFIHKAISDIADQIEHETNLCNTLNGEIPLRNIAPSNDLKHEWNILPSIYRSIKEAGDYEFIDGTFKPNSKKLLQLLAGTELYGKPILAIREIVQNSLDAIKVQMAYKILEDDIKTEAELKQLETKFNINLTVTLEDEEYWITCQDNGVGMDKEVLKKCFLVGGATKRHELLELERRCKKKGHNLEITGQFGIGVLSYFMIADKMIIKTNKSFQSGNQDGNGWEFEINGLSDFGELRKTELVSNGTTVKLRLKKELVSQLQDTNKISALIENTLNRIPCNFSLTSFDSLVHSYSPGWCKPSSFFKEKLIKQFGESTKPEIMTSHDFISEEQLSEIDISNKRKTETHDTFTKSIDFLIDEGTLDDNNGYYRIHVPVFKNEKGDSFAFFFENIEKEEIILERINEGFLFYPNIETPSIGWKGIAINSTEHYGRNFPYSNCIIELDLINEKSFNISVSRLEISYESKFKTILREIENKINALIKLNKKRFQNSAYTFFNHTIANEIGLTSKNLFWTYESGYNEDTIKFEPIKFPLIVDISTDIENSKAELLNGKNYYRLAYLKNCGSTYKNSNFYIKKYKYKFDKAVFHNYYNYRISFIISESFKENIKYSFIGNTAQFPPEWKELFCFRGYHTYDIILNENSPYYKYINQLDFHFSKNIFEGKISLNGTDGNKILKSKKKSFCFITYLISLNEKNYWDGVVKNNPEFVKKLWLKMFGTEGDIIYFFHDGLSNTQLIAISIESWTIIKNISEIKKHLPIPNNEWKIEKKQ